MIQLCFVDDDELLLAGVKRTLRRASASINLTVANSGAEALAILNAQPIHVLISDFQMPSMDGHALMTAVQRQFPTVARVMTTGDIDPLNAFELQLVAQRIVSKPVDAKALVELVQQLGQYAHGSDTLCGHCILPWAQLASRQLTRQRATAITADVARGNPWLAMLLLQTCNGGFISCPQPTHDVESAVRSLGPSQLSIIFNRLAELAEQDSGKSASAVNVRSFESELASMLQLARSIACDRLRSCPETVENKSQAEAVSTAPALSSVVESAALLRVASAAHASPDTLTASPALVASSVDAEARHEAVLHTAAQAARLGVPTAITDAVRSSVGGEPAVNDRAAEVLRQAFAQYNPMLCWQEST